MSPPQKRKDSEDKVQIYETSLNALSTAKIQNYIDSQDPADILERNLGAQLDNQLSVSDEQVQKDFFRLVENLFQSITTKGLFTYEIYEYIIEKIIKIVTTKHKGDVGKQESLAMAYGQAIGNYISVFHKDYYLDDKAKELFNLSSGNKDLKSRTSEAVLSSLFQLSTDRYNVPRGRYGSISYNNLSDDKKNNLSNVACYLNIGKEKSDTTLENKLKDIDVNKDITNPVKLDPSMSIILLNNDNIRCGTKNSLELSAFFNSISTLEFSKAFPYFNATFILPNTSKQDATNVFKTATLNQFLFGSRTKDTTENYNSFEGTIQKDKDRIGVETNLSIFSTPQTAVNMNEKTGHRDIYDEEDKKLRITSVHDRARPFMTFKSFEIDIAPTTGLMSFKSGRISLVLHDRTRMGDIAPFIKPDLFGAFGAEICVEYGWQHGDAGKLNSRGNPVNPIGDFLNSSVCLEKYMITNSQFSVTNSGEVEINLAIAMKGPVDIRQTEIVEHTRLTIDRNTYNTANQAYILQTQNIQKKLKLDTITPAFNANINNAVTSYNDSFSGKYVKTTAVYKKGKRQGRSYTTKNFRIFNNLIINLLNAGTTFKSAEKNGNKIKFTPATKKVTLGIVQSVSGINRNTLIKNGNFFEIDVAGKTIEASDFHALGVSIRRVARALSKIKKFNEKIKDSIDNYVDNLIGGLQDTDLLYDKMIDKGYKEYLSNIDFSNKNYITFGSFLSSLVGTHMSSLKKYDEIQIIFHNVNNRAGFCANFGNSKAKNPPTLSLASLLINKSLLEKYLTDLFERNVRVTVESLISQVISNFILTKDNPCYGMQDFFERKNFKSPVKPKRKKKEDKQEISVSMTQRLNGFYYGTDEKNFAEYDDEGVFIPPSIQLSFDALSDVIDLDKTICRITVYDRNDNPYQSISNCFNQGENINNGGLKEILRLSNKIKNDDKDLNKLKEQANRTVKGSKKNRAKIRAVKKAANKQLEKFKARKIRRQELLDQVLGPNGIIEKFTTDDGRVMFRFKSGKGFLDIKEKTRTLMPTATFASEHTALINASAATVNEAKLNTVYITNQNRNDVTEVNNNVIVDMPLRILPSQASIETFGCPWAGFGQYIFIDFETGTTLDNSYAVTSVKHSLTPGNFKTTLSLSYGDVYGKYEGLADGFNKLIASKEALVSNPAEDARRRESNRKVAEQKVKAEEEILLQSAPQQQQPPQSEELDIQQEIPTPQKIKVIKPERMSRSEKAKHKKQLKAQRKRDLPVEREKLRKIQETNEFTFSKQLTAENIFKFAVTDDFMRFYLNYNVIASAGTSLANIFEVMQFDIDKEIKTLVDNANAKESMSNMKSFIKSVYPLDYLRQVGPDSLDIYKRLNIDKNSINLSFNKSLKKLRKYFKNQIIFSIMFKPATNLKKPISLTSSLSMPTSLSDPRILTNVLYNNNISSSQFQMKNMYLYSRTNSLSVKQLDYFDKIKKLKVDASKGLYNQKIGKANLESIIPEGMSKTNDLYNIFGLVIRNKTLGEDTMYYFTLDNAGIILTLNTEFDIKDDDSNVNLRIQNIEYSEFSNVIENLKPNLSGRFMTDLTKKLVKINYIKEKSISASNIYSDLFMINEADRESTNFEDIKSFFGVNTFEYELLIGNMFDINFTSIATFENSDELLSKEFLAGKINEKLEDLKFNYLLYEINLEKAKYVNSIENVKKATDFFLPGFKSELKIKSGSEDIVATYLSNWTRLTQQSLDTATRKLLYSQEYAIESSGETYLALEGLVNIRTLQAKLREKIKNIGINPLTYIKESSNAASSGTLPDPFIDYDMIEKVKNEVFKPFADNLIDDIGNKTDTGAYGAPQYIKSLFDEEGDEFYQKIIANYYIFYTFVIYYVNDYMNEYYPDEYIELPGEAEENW